VTNNKDIPESEINERVARAQGWIMEHSIECDFWSNPTGRDYACSVKGYKPHDYHNQFHEIWTADMEAKVCRLLEMWFGVIEEHDTPIGLLYDIQVDWYDNPKYQANRRLWQLRAIVEVLENDEK
jgi:hypothetical protein